MKTVSVGFFRVGGDFQILATLNNNDDLLNESDFVALVEKVREQLQSLVDESIQILERQDTPDYVDVE